MKAELTTTPTTLVIDMSANSYSKYQVYIKQWRLDGSEADTLPGFPRTTSSKTISVDNLEPGRYFRVSHL